MAHLSGENGGVYTGSYVVEDCEDAWNELVDGDVTASADSSDYKVGSASAKFVCAAGLGAGDIIATEVVNLNMSGYDVLVFWFKSSVALNAGDIQLLLDDNAQCASPIKLLDLPAIAANTWTRVCLDLGDASGLTAVISIGLKQIVDKGAMNLWIDDVRMITVVEGIRAWTLHYEFKALDVRDFADSGEPSRIAGVSDWNCTFEGWKDGAPVGLGSKVIIVLAESKTAGQAFIGQVFITGVDPSVSVDDAVGYRYTAEAAGALEVASV